MRKLLQEQRDYIYGKEGRLTGLLVYAATGFMPNTSPITVKELQDLKLYFSGMGFTFLQQWINTELLRSVVQGDMDKLGELRGSISIVQNHVTLINTWKSTVPKYAFARQQRLEDPKSYCCLDWTKDLKLNLDVTELAYLLNTGLMEYNVERDRYYFNRNSWEVLRYSGTAFSRTLAELANQK